MLHRFLSFPVVDFQDLMPLSVTSVMPWPVRLGKAGES